MHIKTTRLIMIRHAESLGNAERRVQGWTDAPLSEHGQEQVQRLAVWLRDNNPGAQELFASPLQRTLQTAEGVGNALALPVQTRPGLREVYMGDLEDSHESIFVEAMESAESEATFEQQYGIETTLAFTERVLGTLHGLMAAHDGRTLVVVTHLGVICTALAYWLDRDITQAWTKYGHIRNSSMTEVVFHERIEMLRSGELPHL
jgi:probable phosphoglycerate mutase